MTTLNPPKIKRERAHVVALAEIKAKSDRVRYAADQRPDLSVPDLLHWLSAHDANPAPLDNGKPIRREYAVGIVKSYREGRKVTDTGDLPKLTPEMLAEIDAANPDDVMTAGPVETPPADVDPAPAPVIDMPAPAVDVDAAPAPAETSAVTTVETPEPEAPTRRTPRPLALATLALSTVATVAAGVWVSRVSLADALALPTGVKVGGGVAAALVVALLVWSATSVATALVAGRSSRDVALDVASWVVALIAGFLAAAGQVAFAHWAGIEGWTAYLVPGILEPSVVVLLLLANRRVQKAVAKQPTKPIGPLMALAALLGGFAVYTNVVHSPARSGLVFGAATVIGLILWWVKLQDSAGAVLIIDAPQSKRLSRRTARYRVLRWIILPRQTLRAWLISLDHSIDDAERGLDLARRWRREYTESRDTGVGVFAARRFASSQIDKYLTS